MGGWGGLHSDFRVKPTRCVRLCWGWGFDNCQCAVFNSNVLNFSLPIFVKYSSHVWNCRLFISFGACFYHFKLVNFSYFHAMIGLLIYVRYNIMILNLA